jgi:glucan endo-1,3-alpha-glucosidase
VGERPADDVVPGWLDLQEYYIRAYKTGTYPRVERDRLFLWGRLYPARAQSQDSLKVPMNSEFVSFFPSLPYSQLNPLPQTEDFVWVVALLAAPAQIGLGCGESKLAVNLPAGVSKLRLPLVHDCSVVAILVRGGTVVLRFEPQGFRFSTTPHAYNYNAFVAASP